MNNIKKVALSGVGLSLLATNRVFAAPAQKALNPEMVTQGTLVETIQGWIVTLMTLLIIVATIYGLYGGFLILTAAQDEDKVKKGKTVIINALIGIVVIFTVGMLMRWLFGLLNDNSVDQ